MEHYAKNKLFTKVVELENEPLLHGAEKESHVLRGTLIYRGFYYE